MNVVAISCCWLFKHKLTSMVSTKLGDGASSPLLFFLCRTRGARIGPWDPSFQALCNVHKVDEAYHMVQKMVAKCCTPYVFTYNILAKGFCEYI
jgi:pentatricopeptide repeat protein